MYKTRTTCRLCESKDLFCILKLEPSALANEFVKTAEKQDTFPLDLYKCGNCHHYQILDVVDPDRLFRNYVYVSGTSKLMRQHFRNYACEVVSDLNLDEKDFVVEMGSNDGTLLEWFHKLGIKVLGVDPAVNLATKTFETKGVHTIPDFFTRSIAQKIKQEKGEASVVIGNNIFAHADNLDEIVLAVKDLLKPGGKFIFEVSYFVNMVECKDFSQMYHEHTSYHTVSALNTFFEKHKMWLWDVKKIDVHGGSIRCEVINKPSPGYASDRAEDMIWEETDGGFNTQDSKYRHTDLARFIRHTNSLKTTLRTTLIDLKSQGKTIAAVAAAAKSTTFLHQCNIGTDLIDYICDDAPEKQGLLTPGKHIPVVPFSTIYEKKPDYLLMLSFNFVDSIIKKHKDYAGKWIVPLPTYQIRHGGI